MSSDAPLAVAQERSPETAELLPKQAEGHGSALGGLRSCHAKGPRILAAAAVAAALVLGGVLCLLSPTRSGAGQGELAQAETAASTNLRKVIQDFGVPPGVTPAQGVSQGLPEAIIIGEKPRGDSRQYQFAELHNGLRVVNVQDRRARQTAVAVAVKSGSFNDPIELPGLAHFCEHMLFLGTRSFPENSGFDSFISQNGGTDNAYTDNEVTVYFGEVTQAAAKEEMARLADFFRAPLFDKQYVEKEVHAIDSEHQKNVQSPTFRIFQTLNSLADPQSPIQRFHTGDLETLYTSPMRNGTSPVDALKVYFKDHYCPKHMRLVVIGAEPLAQQLAQAAAQFGDIPAGSEACQRPVPNFAVPPAFPPDRMGKWVTIQGTQPQAQLWLHFPLPDLTEDWKSQPLEYIDHMLSYKGVHSLSRVLQDSLGLAASLETTYAMSSAGTNFYVVVVLTELGAANARIVLDVFYLYVTILLDNGVDRNLYQTLADVLKLKWDWSEPDEPMDAASDLAERMTRLPPHSLLYGDTTIEQPNAQLVADLLGRLTPLNMNVAYVHPHATESGLLNASQARELPHYGVRFSVEELANRFPGAPAEWQFWLQHKNVAMAKQRLRERLRVEGLQATWSPFPKPPGPIEGVPTKISQVYMHAEDVPNVANISGYEPLFGPRPKRRKVTGPQIGGAGSDVTQVASEPDIWYRRGWVTTSPKVAFRVALRPLQRPDEPEPTALDAMRLGLYARLLGEEMKPKLVDLTITGVSYEADVSTQGLSFSFGGFAPLVSRLVGTVLNELNRFNANASLTSPERFERVVQEVRQELTTYDKMPVEYAVQEKALLLTHGGHGRAESLAALSGINLESAADSTNQLLLARQLHLTAFAIGNMAEPEARDVVRTLATGITRPMSMAGDGSGQVEYVTKVVNPAVPVEVRRVNPRPGDPNDVAVVSILYGVSTVESRVLLGLLGQILGMVAYTELRTKRQLGYVVSASTAFNSNVQYISCAVQGNTLGADDMEAAIELLYTRLMPERLRELTEDEFESYKSSFRQKLLEPPMSPVQEVTHFWGPIKQGGHCFGLRRAVLRYLNSSSVTRELLLDTWNELMVPAGVDALRKKVAVKYFAKAVPPRPVEAQVAEALAKQGVNGSEVSLLLREHASAQVFGKVDSDVRATVVARGGYFPQDLLCHVRGEDGVPPINPTTTSAEPELVAPATTALAAPAASDQPAVLPPQDAGEALLEALEDRAEEVTPNMGARDLAKTLDAFKLLATRPSAGLIAKLERRMKAVAVNMSGPELAMVYDFFGTSTTRLDKDAVEELGRRAQTLAPTMSPSNVSCVINAYAVMGLVPEEELVAALGQRAKEVAPHMDAQDVARVLKAYAALWVTLGKLVVGAVHGKVDMQKSENVLGTFTQVWKLNQLKAIGDPLFDELGERAGDIVGDMTAKDVSDTLEAYAMLGKHPGQTLFRQLGGRATEVAASMAPADVSRALDAFARFGQRPEAPLVAALMRMTKKLTPYMGAHDVALTLNACAMLALPIDDAMLRALGSRAREQAGAMSAHDVANLLRAYSALSAEPDAALLGALSARTVEVADDLTSIDVANVLGTYAGLHQQPQEALWTVLEKSAQKVGPNMNARNVSNVANAYVVLKRRPGLALIAVLCKRAQEVATDMDAHEVSVMLNAYAKLWHKVGKAMVAELQPGAAKDPAARARGSADALRLTVMEKMGEELWAALGARAEAVAEDMNATDVANVLEAYAQLRKQPDPSLLQALGHRLTQVVGDMSAKEVARTLSAYAQLKAAQAPPQG